MKIAVIYDSEFGNTEVIAKTVANVMEAFGAVELTSFQKAEDISWKNLDLLIVGGLTQQQRISPGLEAWLGSFPRGELHSLKVAAFDTRY
ncbi:MAG: flavodoxin domain-containing protein [Anaerolineales bacterium]